MADSLGDLLQHKHFDEPPEVLVIKTFLHENYQADCQVTMGQRQIIITVKGASLAGTIRMRLHELLALCQTDKRLVIRIVN
ncbi:MAG TPA: hypothetical protein VLE74_03425 [Candidatus Saccharimonadales bacterium]|nr:hypothetical protein [Candidatus Saccharimonadales bacterium]